MGQNCNSQILALFRKPGTTRLGGFPRRYCPQIIRFNSYFHLGPPNCFSKTQHFWMTLWSSISEHPPTGRLDLPVALGLMGCVKCSSRLWSPCTRRCGDGNFFNRQQKYLAELQRFFFRLMNCHNSAKQGGF